MQTTERRSRRRRRSYNYAAAGLGLLGFFLIVASLWPGDWAWIFAVAGFLGFVLFTRQALAFWNLDRLVFGRRAFPGRTRAATSGLEVSGVPSLETLERPEAPRVLAWQSRTRLSSAQRSAG